MLDFIKRKENWFKRPKILLIAALVFALVGVIYASIIFSSKNYEQVEKEQSIIKQVKTSVIGNDAGLVNTIEVAGLVKPVTQVDVVALSSGTVTNISFEVGKTVSANELLVQLSNEQIFTNLNTSNLNVSNLQQGFSVIGQLTDEMVRQAELGVKNAQESVASAGIGLQAAQDNLNNSITLQDKRIADTKTNAIVSYYSYLNSAKNVLDQINYILKVEGNSQLPGIAATLGVLDSSSVVRAEQSYSKAKDSYDKVLVRLVDINSIETDITVFINILTQVKTAVDNTINVLDNTIASTDFSDTALISQKNNFSNLRNSVVNNQTATQNSLFELQNLELINKQELDTLKNGVEAAQKRLDLAKVGYENSLVSLDNVIRSKEQQVIGARISLNNAQGRLQLVNSQLADLSVQAPVGGQVTGKYVELGDELIIGSKIATISQTDLVKIVINLSAEDIYKIKLGNVVDIKDDLIGTITQIDPVADVVSRKIKVEIVFDNINKELIPETFVPVSIVIDKKKDADKIYVSLSAVTITQTESFVFINQDGQAKKVGVELGGIKATAVEIVSGLDYGDEVIIEGSRELSDGDSVVVKNDS